MHVYFAWLRNKIVIGCIVVALLIIGFIVWRHSVHDHDQTATVDTSKCPTTPAFKTILPSGQTIDSLGGWRPLCPPDSAPAYVYTDAIDGVSISVTEQPLPTTLQDNPSEQIADLANKSNYTDEIDAGSTKAYVGTSAKGPQSAMLTKANLFINIKSTSKITDDAWARYIKSLQ